MIKVGIGYDVHRLKKGEELIIGGIKIPSAFGSEGHSDGDALIHAIVDAHFIICRYFQIKSFKEKEKENAKK